MNVQKLGLLSAAILCGLTVTTFAQERVVEVERTRPPAGPDAGFFKASDLIGMEVRGPEKQDLGEVQDLFINRQTHEIEYLILDTGVVADLDGNQPVIPWMIADMHPGADAGTYYLSIPITQERIKTAPMINLSVVELTRSPTFVADVDKFYSEELKARRVSRPDLDQNRENAAPRSSRNADQPTPERQPRNPNSTDANRKNLKPDSAGKSNSTTPKKPVNP